MGHAIDNNLLNLQSRKLPSSERILHFVFLSVMMHLVSKALIFFILLILLLKMTITWQILFKTKKSNKIEIDVNTLVKKPIEHKTFYIKT